MTVDTKKLRELAEAATHLRDGQKVDGPAIVDNEIWHYIEDREYGRIAAAAAEEDCDFIAAANPQAVIALLNEIERLTNLREIDYIASKQLRHDLREQLAAMTKARDEAYAKGRADQVAAEHAKATDRWCDET